MSDQVFFLRAPFDEGKAEERIRTLEKAVVEEGQSAEGKGNRKEMNLCDFGLCPLTALLAAPSSGYQAAWYGGPVGLLSAQTWFETHCVPLASYPTSLHLNFLTCKMRLIKSIVQGCFGNLYFILIVVKYT